MKLLKTLLNEDAAAGATTATAVAGVREPIGAKEKNTKKKDKKQKNLKNSLLRRVFEQDDSSFDADDVMTKLSWVNLTNIESIHIAFFIINIFRE